MHETLIHRLERGHAVADSDLARAAGETCADHDLEDSAGAGKGMKNRASSQVLILASDVGPQAATTETTSAWAGEKKSKIQSTHNFGEHSSSGRIVGGQEIEGLDWDDDKITKEINDCLRRFKDAPILDEYASDDESLLLYEEHLRVLNRRLALCRIRAHDHEEKYKDMDDESLSELFPPSKLEAMEYYKHYEHRFEWHFDPVYCHYVHLQDYQRLMLRNNSLYEDWEHYRKICSTLEGDQEFVHFWEELYSKTELIEWYMTGTYPREPRIGNLFYYHALKIAAAGHHPNVYSALIDQGFIEFRNSMQNDFTVCRHYADFLFEMWRLLAREKMGFEDALRRVFSGGNYSIVFASVEFERNLGHFEELYKPLLDRALEKADEADVKGLIMDFIKGSPKRRRTYYDYAKKKLRIAKEIGLIS